MGTEAVHPPWLCASAALVELKSPAPSRRQDFGLASQTWKAPGGLCWLARWLHAMLSEETGLSARPTKPPQRETRALCVRQTRTSPAGTG